MSILSDIGRYLRTGVVSRPPQRLSVGAAPASKRYSTLETLTPSYSLVDPESYVRDGFRRNALVHRCVELVAGAVAEPRIIALRRASSRSSKAGEPETEEELAPPDPLAELVARPSSEYPTQTRFIRQVVRHLLLAGEAIIYKVPGERTGATVELQLLRPDKVEVTRGSSGERVYVYRPDGNVRGTRLSAEQVMHTKLDDPLNADRGLPPLAAAARETDSDNEAADFRKAFFENGAMVSGILSTDHEATPEQLEKWTVMWRERYSGAAKAGRTPALAGGLTYQPVGAKPGEISFGELTSLSELRICQAFGVPPALAYAQMGIQRLTYNNYQQARRALWEEAASPLLGMICEELTAGLTEPAEGKRIGADKSKVPALQEDADAVAKRFSRALSDGAVTVNEYREKLGLEPVEDGNVLYRPANVEIVEKE